MTVEKMKQSFFDMMKNDRMKFMFFLMYAGAFGMFLLSIFMPYMRGEMLIGGGVSLFTFPGHSAYTGLFVALALLSLYTYIKANDQNTRILMIFTASVASLIFLYGLLLHKVGIPDARNGLGKILAFVAIVAMWTLIFGHRFVKKQLIKYAHVEETDTSKNGYNQGD
jgi:hypothetical protein